MFQSSSSDSSNNHLHEPRHSECFRPKKAPKRHQKGTALCTPIPTQTTHTTHTTHTISDGTHNISNGTHTIANGTHTIANGTREGNAQGTLHGRRQSLTQFIDSLFFRKSAAAVFQRREDGGANVTVVHRRSRTCHAQNTNRANRYMIRDTPAAGEAIP